MVGRAHAGSWPVSDGALTEAYERFHRTGPEWGADQLTNHGPMVAEVLVRRGRPEVVPGWVDRYLPRLDDGTPPADKAPWSWGRPLPLRVRPQLPSIYRPPAPSVTAHANPFSAPRRTGCWFRPGTRSMIAKTFTPFSGVKPFAIMDF